MWALRALHGIDLRGALGQRTLRPALPGVLAGEHLAATGGAVHSSRLPWVEGDGEDGGLWLDAHLHPRPSGSTVLAAEQNAELALEARACRHPDGPRIAGNLADIAAVGLPLGIQRLEPRAGPVLTPIHAAEEAGPADGEDGPGAPAPHQHAVHVDRVVVHILPVAHVLPVLTAVQAADDAADLDRAVELVGIGRIHGELQNALGRVGAGSHGDLRKADGHRELPPVIAAVLAPKDLAVLVAGIQHPGGPSERQRP